MDSEYDRKFDEMKKYIPFLESMIKRLENTSSSSLTNPRQAQLDKIRSLRDLLLNKNKRMKMENLLKCEQVLVNLYAKVERDPFSDRKLATEKDLAVSKDKSELETVRNKLKTVAKIQDGVETLPEIARANDIELNYTGSKEPALFQRRPNKSSKSPTSSVQKSPSELNSRSPQSQSKRNYTRVLVSPDRSPGRWPTPPESSSEKPLFSRRSPPKIISPPSLGKKEKKKYKASKSRKTNDLNITLNVPQESLNSLNTEDILSRIINCKDGDVDIDTLRELRTQILGELKQTGKNDDISDLILKSYNIQSKPRKKITGKNSKEDVEEGELSDSESEAIESIYGSLPKIDKDKKSSTLIKTIENKDQQRKIQICLVISDKVESNTTDNTIGQSQVIDLVSELEMCSSNESDKSKEIISIDSDTPLSPPKKGLANKNINENTIVKTKIDTPLVKQKDLEKTTECITIDDDNKEELKDEAVEVVSVEETDESSPDNLKKNYVESKDLTDSNVTKSVSKSPTNNNAQTLNEKGTEHNQNVSQVDETVEQRPQFVANFYKPIEEQQKESPASSTVTNILEGTQNLADNNIVAKPAQPVCITNTYATKNLSEKQNTEDSNKNTGKVSSENKTFNLESISIEKEKLEDSQAIPLLNEPTVPPKAKASVLSEIDILQALKNEILSGSISMPGAEVVTPALHQPKLTKVANAQEVMPKKKISIEKYKEKVSKSTDKPLFFTKRNRANRMKQQELNRKQSLKLTEKECERFNFPKRLSFDDDDEDDIDDISDDDFLTEDKDDSLGLDDIYGDLAPKSPENETLNRSTTPPVIIPTDLKSFNLNVVKNRGDVDMRTLLPTPIQQSVPLPVPPPFIPTMGCGTVPPSPGYGIDRHFSEVADSSKNLSDMNRVNTIDPRKRRDLNLSAMNSPNPYAAINSERTSKSLANVVTSTPNMTPSRIQNMTPNYMPSIPQLRTPNARTFEMTPTHQTFQLEESATRKHVYAPSFPICDNRERESSVPKDGSYWDTNNSNPRSRRSQWEESNNHAGGPKWEDRIPRSRDESNKHVGGPIWEDRDPRSSSGQNDGSYTPRYEDAYTSKCDRYNNRLRGDNYNTHDRRESYSNTDCPPTPVPSFGWSECPLTPSIGFGRQEAPMTPSHPFGRSDCPTTPIHPFGRGDCPSLISGIGRNVDMTSNHSYTRTESECPLTPIHPFGRSECPRTPSHPFGRSENISYRPDIANNSNQMYSKDPRLNRRPEECESSSYNERKYDYKNERKNSSYKSKSKHYSGLDPPRNYEREQSEGRNDRESGDRNTSHYDRNRRDVSLGSSTPRDVENNIYSRNRESRYDRRYSKGVDDALGHRQNQRERSISRTRDTNQYVERARSRALSVGRMTDKELNKDNISFRSETGRNFTINTSVKSTFQDFLSSGKPIQVFDYSFDARRQRAASVGRSFVRETSVGRTLSTGQTTNYSSYAHDRKNKFKRASSVGREMGKSMQSLQEVKADFEIFKSKLKIQDVDTSKESKSKEVKNDFEALKSKFTVRKVDTNKESSKHTSSQLSPRITNDQDTSHKNKKNKQYYSPRKNNRDPRNRKEHPTEIRSRYKIDRRSDLRDSRKSGIIYSNDNIAKGTIMGSGFGVKNYKIPKIKRVEPEVPEVKTSEKEISDLVEKSQSKKDSKENDKKTKQNTFKEPAKLIEEPIVKINSNNQNESKKSSNFIDEVQPRVTRSKKRTDLNKSKDDVDDEDVVVKTRKSKKSVIYDSDSDSVSENEVSKKCTKSSKPNSPSKKTNNQKNVITPIILNKDKDVIDESLDSNFGIDDMEIFSENLESNSVIDNINALIADLDNDLNTPKTSNDIFIPDIEKMIDNINSPGDNSFSDISEVIEKDLNKSSEFQQALIADNLLNDNIQIVSNTNQPRSPVIHSNGLDITQNASLLIDVAKHPDLKQSTKDNIDDTGLSKVNEAIVSTTEIDQETNGSKVQTGIEDVINEVDQSIPDSTIIDKSVLNKPNDGLPDSTNQIHSELSSDVTSTIDTAMTSNKESDIQSKTQKEAFNSIGSLLSILQDKSKIKELLAMLGDQSSDNEKIKKKLEKLSEIVSDDEEEEEGKLESMVHKLDTTAEEKPTEETVVVVGTDKHEVVLKDEVHKSDEIFSTLNVEKIFEKEMPADRNVESNQDKLYTTHNKPVADEPSIIETDSKHYSENENKNTTLKTTNTIFLQKTSDKETNKTENKDEKNTKSIKKTSEEETNLINKLNDEVQSDAEDDEPLVKKVTKNIKNKKSNVKSKVAPIKHTNKRTTRAVPAKTGVKKRGELQKLQEDIKEMFMHDDILNATGIRMCRLAKMISEQESMDSGPVVVLEKVKEGQNQDQPTKIRKKPGPKAKNKPIENRVKSPEANTKFKSKSLPKYKPGPRSKTKLKSDNTDPYEFDTESVADTNTTKDSDEDSSDSENESLASAHSFGSSEVFPDTKKKPRRKRRGIGGWQSGIIKSKNRKKKEYKQETPKNDPSSPVIKSLKPITIPDLNCFTDKSYCFKKGATTYDCRLCVYSGADIVNHYKKLHSHNEIPLSRMDQKTAELAIQQCEQKNFQALSKISSDKYTCRFCYKEFSNNRNVLETFFWHVVSNHTGEFKHLCSECVNVTRCPFNLDIPPPPKDGGQLIGYICQKCNFTQISLENLKTHVIEHHNDEQTEVFTINLAVMSTKAMNAMMRRARAEKPRVLRSLRSNQNVGDYNENREDQSELSESSGHNSECEPSEPVTEEIEQKPMNVIEQKPKIDQMKAKLTFENDEPSDETSVKMEQEDRDGTSHIDDMLNVDITSKKDSCRGNSDDIIDYPHFKLNYTESGAKEYVCCINGNDSHYKTSLLISMKKHIQTKHTEKWDGYCSKCKVIVTLQGVQSDFRDCMSHFLDKHMDDFPVLEKVTESAREETETSSLPEENVPATCPDVATSIPPTVASALPVAALSPAIPSRVATPPVERTASPSYIAVRPLAELLSRELVSEVERPEQETPIALPKIENIVSLGEENVPPPQPSPSYPTNAPAPVREKPFLYEEVQAEVMSKKHRVVLDAMMSKENLVKVFKCAGRFCSFTTDSPEDALLHASTHQRVGGEGALNCAYCNYDACDNGIDLVMHAFKEHSRCQYCCPMCFYRAAASQLVGEHYAKAHSGAIKLKKVLRSATAVPPPTQEHSTGLLPRDIAVQHFICNHDNGVCNYKTYTPGKFIEHLQQWHANAKSHPCNLCTVAVPSVGELVLHLRSHGLKLYQCTWCVHGANNEGELLAHAAAQHPGSQPQAYIRVITSKEGGKRVLPLAYLNKSKLPIEDVAPNNMKDNPVKEAERSIELEKLIAHTMIIDATSQSFRNTDNAAEEPMEIPIESLPDEQDCDGPTDLASLLTATDQNASSLVCSETLEEPISEPLQKSNTTKTQNQPPEVKPEPAEMINDVNSSDIICLDSDDESDGAADEAPATSNDEVPNSSGNENVAQDVSTEVSRSSVTNEVTITKVTEDESNKSTEKLKQNEPIENIIDLSDDDLALSNETKSNQIVDRKAIFKCPNCLNVSKTLPSFRKHLGKRCSRLIGRTPQCPHLQCTYVAPNISKLIAHYLEVHDGAPKKPMVYHCGVCSVTFASMTGAKLHIRSIHKVLSYTVNMKRDEKGIDNYFINAAPEAVEPVRISGRKTSTEIQRYQAELGSAKTRKTSTEAKKRYGTHDIGKLPITPIFDSEVYCELCEFGTKVRLNLVRHLQQHAGNVPVPHTAPVNPVPHLETNEMHFDRMVNLASSSVAARPDRTRADEPSVAIKISAAESSLFPKYVPERVRYTCGAKDCSYISVDMAMFRCHWETLHPRDQEYRCVHCPPTQALTTSVSLNAARIVSHLRMHDINLYTCSVCSYYHYRKQFIEKHISELHPEGTVRVVREEYQPEAAGGAPPAAPAPTPGAPTMDLKSWQCGLCDFSSMLRPKVVNHCATEHQSKMQFKCASCSFRSSAKENVVKHQSNAHPTLRDDVFYYFYREGSILDEDGIPRWQKQRQKLGLDEREVKTEPEPSEPIAETPKTPISVTPPSVAIDLNIVKEETPDEQAPDAELSLDDLCKKFGELCEPDGIKYKCCLCKVVREHSREAMQGHLYEELNYRRWECVICSYKAFHKTGLNDHMASEHSRQFHQPRALPVDANIEKWVRSVLDHQAIAIESNLSNLSAQKIQGERQTAPISVQKPESPKPTSNASDSELQKAFGDFGAPKNHQFACPKCEFTTKDESAMVTHLESELTKIRWGCAHCTSQYQSYHEAEFHSKSVHLGKPSRPMGAIRDPSLRSGWVKSVVASQRQFLKCILQTNREPTPEKNTEDSDQSENSLLVALYDEPVQIDERPVKAKRPAAKADSDDERLVIDDPPTKRLNDRKCPFCDYNIQNTRYVREHILKEHYNMKPYKCYYCSYSGTRQAVTSHTNSAHVDLPKRIVVIDVPKFLPSETRAIGSEPTATSKTTTYKRDRDEAASAKTLKRDGKDTEEVAKKVCLYCEKSVPETEMSSHTHGPEVTEFAKRGEVVIKCCKCLVLRLSMTSLQEHFDACHPGEKVLDNYAYFKLQVDTREIHCCGHCHKKFKFLRDLKVHHSTSHTSLSLSFNSIPFSHNLHTEGDAEIGKRKADDTIDAMAKRVAKKSTTKLPNSPVAKKSTTKLPTRPDVEESSCYGTKPLPLDHYKNVTLNMPLYNSTVEVSVEKLGGLLNPKVVVKDYRS